MHAAAAAHAAHSQIAQAAAAAALQLLPVTGKAAPGISQAMTAMNSISSVSSAHTSAGGQFLSTAPKVADPMDFAKRNKSCNRRWTSEEASHSKLSSPYLAIREIHHVQCLRTRS